MRYVSAAIFAICPLLLGTAPAQAAGITLIHDIQGSGSSGSIGGRVTVEAVVVGDFQGAGGLSGFFIQEEDADADNDAATSEGIFVYDGSGRTDVVPGDLVQVTGTAKEYYDMTQISNASVKIVSRGNALPALVDVQLPVSAGDALERYEGMRVRLPQTLTATESYNLGRFGEVWLSSGGRLMAPTAVAAPGADANAVQAANDLNRILFDDGSETENPDPIVYPAPALSAVNTLRSGDTVAGAIGVLGYAYGAYRLHPTQAPGFVGANDRTTAPAQVNGSLRVASFNVLNYFNGDGTGGGFPTSRGAGTAEELQRQRDKIIAAIGDLNAHAMEDPITTIESAGYTDLLDLFIGSGNTYSYIFMGQAGYLDHALANSSLAGQVSGVTAWHINTDEPRALDYNTEYKTQEQISSLYAPDAYRASDHDPVVVGLSLK